MTTDIKTHGTSPYRYAKSLLANPLFVLGLVGGLSLLVYLLLLVRPLYLLEVYTQTRLDIYYLRRNPPYYHIRMLVAYLMLGGLYVRGWLAARKLHGRLAWGVTLGGALACAIVLLFMAPFDAADIYDNILHGRILGVYGGNPFTDVARDFPNDPFYEYMAWKKVPSAYGPLWEGLAGGAARLAGDGVVANVLTFKLLPGLFWLASLIMAAVFMRQTAPQHALSNIYLLAWNPGVLFSTWGNGHNDIVVVFWLILTAWCVFRRRYDTAVLALLAGALFKFIPLLLLPAVIGIALRELGETRNRLRYLMLTAFTGMALVLLAYLPFWNGWDTLTLERRSLLFTSSLPSVAFQLLKPELGIPAARLVSLCAAGLTGLFALWRSWRAYLDRKWSSFAEAGFDMLTFYLLITCLWFQQWYTLWLVGLAAILPDGYRQRFAIFFSLAAFSKPLLMRFFLFDPYPIYTQPKLEILFTLGVLGLPWLYWLAAYFDTRYLKPDPRNPTYDARP